MTLVEFLAPLGSRSNRDKCLALLYFEHRYSGTEALTVEQIRKKLKAARVKRWAKVNVADVLAKSGHYVDSPGVEGGKRLWKLTDSGQQHVRQLLGLPAAEPEVEHDVSTLATLAAKLSDAEVRAYIEESITCLQVGALRAAVVFLWVGTIRVIQQELMAKGTGPCNTAITKHDPRARAISKLDDFAYIKDKTVLLAAQDVGLFDKSERTALEQALDLRNSCGHPTKYRPGVKKASSFIEDVANIVFA